MVKISLNRFVTRRIDVTRREVKSNTQKLRKRTLKNPEEIFRLATRIGRGETKHQRNYGKTVPINLDQLRGGARVAAYAAQTMNSIASNLNEQEIDAQLNELEELVKGTKANLKMKDLRPSGLCLQVDASK
jgi:hypothetical protein